MSKTATLLLYVLFLQVFYCATAQDYQHVDAVIQLYPERFDTPEDLSKFISRDFETDDHKVRAMYSWMIKNIAYDPDEYKMFNFKFKNYRERNQKEEKTRKSIIERTLQKGVAVCEGYAMLLERLCELQGIPNYLVRGDIKTNFDDIGRPFRTVHMWNVIVIDGRSFLFDATWGAGKYRVKFIKEPNYFYFKTPPELLIKNHYPAQYEDALLNEQLSRELFAAWPLILVDQMPLDAIETPASGIIDSQAVMGDIVFSLKVPITTQISYSYGFDKVIVSSEEINGMTTFKVPLELGQRQLLIYFDDKPALGYKIK